MFVQKAHGIFLTRYASLHGLKRRWFGLEPDWMLRRRILSVFRNNTTMY
jgi:hypothetical protein